MTKYEIPKKNYQEIFRIYIRKFFNVNEEYQRTQTNIEIVHICEPKYDIINLSIHSRNFRNLKPKIDF